MRSFAFLACALALVATVAGPGNSPAAGPDGTWSVFPTDSLSPTGMDGFAAALDSRRDRLIVLGGGWHSFWHGPIDFYDSATWAYDLTGATHWSVAATAHAAAPTQVQNGAVVYDPVADVAWAIGGARWNSFTASFGGFDGQLWRLDLGVANPSWAPANVTGTIPPARMGHVLAFDRAGRRLVLFGGRDAAGTALADTWTIPVDGATLQWSPVPSTGPAARAFAAGVIDPGRNRLVVAGGVAAPGDTLSDGWALDLATLAWSPLATPTSGPKGPLAAAWDPARDRMVAFAGPGAVSSWELAFAPAPAWTALAPAGAPPPVQKTWFVAVMDSARDQVLDVSSDAETYVSWPFDQQRVRLNALHFAPLLPVDLTASLMASYHVGYTILDWNVTTTRALYAPVEILRIDPGGPVTVGGGYPDANGILEALDHAPVAGAHYDYRLRWFDGTTTRTTPLYGIDTPPAPVVLDVSLPQFVFLGDYVRAGWTVGPPDSINWLTPIGVEERVGAGPWTLRTTEFPVSGTVLYAIQAEDTPTRHAFRLAWGPTTTEYHSAPDSFTTLPVPALVGAGANPLAAVIEWHYAGGPPFDAALYRLDLSTTTPQATVSADANGLIHYEDPYTGTGYLEYQLEWNVGGAPRRSAVTNVPVQDQRVDILSVVSADTGAVALTWANPDLDNLKVLVLERQDGAAWDSLAALSLQVPVPQRKVTDDGVSAGDHVTYRTRWLEGGVYVHSQVLAVDVPDSVAGSGIELALGAAAPNPCRGALAIPVSVPPGETARLEILDVAGRRVHAATIAAAAGYSGVVSPPGLRAGIYFARLSTPQQTIRRKYVLLP